MRCPTCDSPSPELHPAIQCGGEVEVCHDPFHADARIPVGWHRATQGWLERDR